jgi:hypothetical protein
MASFEAERSTRWTMRPTTRSRPAARRGEKAVEAELAEQAEDGSDVSVGQAAANLEAAGREEALAGEAAADQVDDVVREVGEVADGLVLDLAALAEGAAQQVGLVDLALVVPAGGGDVDLAVAGGHERMIAGPGPEVKRH